MFSSPAEVQILRAAMRRVMHSRPFGVEAMVVLPDHLHCLWRLPAGDADFSGRWREIKKAVSRRFGTPVWQPRFWEHLIRDADDWRRHLDYIHFNPVKHGLAARPAAWPWSSFRRCVARGWYDPDWGATEPAGIVQMNRE